MSDSRFSVDSVFSVDSEVLMNWYQVVDEEMGGGIAMFQFEEDALAFLEFKQTFQDALFLIMQTYLVTTESGLVQEELIHYDDAEEVAQWMSAQYETDVLIYKDNELLTKFTFTG